MSQRATPLFVDTSAFYARFVENAPRHERAMAVFDGIADGEVPYRPLVTSSYVLSELATLLLRKAGHEVAANAVSWVVESDRTVVLHPGAAEFDATRGSFERYDDQDVSFVDHSTVVLARARDVDHVFAFDDDFRTFDLTLVPEETGV